MKVFKVFGKVIDATGTTIVTAADTVTETVENLRDTQKYSFTLINGALKEAVDEQAILSEKTLIEAQKQLDLAKKPNNVGRPKKDTKKS